MSPETSVEHEPRLSLEAALATRIIGKRLIPGDLMLWLANPTSVRHQVLPHVDRAVCSSLDQIISPLLREAEQWEHRAVAQAADWLSVLSVFVVEQGSKIRLGVGKRLLAAGLLPLYRSLATGRLQEGLTRARVRLSEAAVLVAACTEIGPDLVEVIDERASFNESPHTALKSNWDIDLRRTAERVREQIGGYLANDGAFSADSIKSMLCGNPATKLSVEVEWAAPEILWRLSGELISSNSELILPRSWIETPVPWASIRDHRDAFEHLLVGLSLTSNRLGPSADSGIIEVGTGNPEANPGMSVNKNPQGGEHSATLGSTQAASPEFPELSTAVPVHLSPDGQPSTSTSLMAGPEHRAPEFPVLPRILIAEIHTHNDPVFVSLIKRQIAKCRAEERAVALVTIVVQPENSDDAKQIHNPRENGLTLWQQKLVNWLAVHPQVVEPHAFLTTERELLVCLLDLERGEVTSIIRHGLVEVLSGLHIDSAQETMLAKVAIPARYYAGIASTSAPGASFSPEQLIEPAVRCLSAASRLGKATIKSIEAY